MLGFSLPKLIVLGLIVAAIWYGFKYLNRVKSNQNSAPSSDEKKSVPDGTVDMIKCETCGDYVEAKGMTACGKTGCPYPGA